MTATVLERVTDEIDRFGFGRTVDDVADWTKLPKSEVREALETLEDNGQVRVWTGHWDGKQHYARLMGSWPSLCRPH